jgi:signal transduction histidine kinase
MDIQRKYRRTDMVSALADFAQLAQQMLVANTSDALEAGALAVLKRLLALCEMQQGMLLLATRDQSTPKQLFWPSLTQDSSLRILARQGLDNERLLALLATFTSNEEIQLSSTEPAWVICQQLLLFPDASHPTLSPQCLFFLGKSESAHQIPQAALIEKYRQVWSQVAAAIGTAMASLLQTEQMHKLTTAMRRHNLQQMELLKAELLASVSHELRSPLASIKGYTATLLHHERRISRDERLEFLLAIHNASQRMELVIDRLLEMSQLETETLPLQFVPVDLTYIVREAITAREQQTGENNPPGSVLQKNGSAPQVTWTFHLRIEDSSGYPTSQLPLIQADRRLVREVIDHLLENAVLYSPGGGTIEIVLCTRKAHQFPLLLAQAEGAAARALTSSSSWPQNQLMAEIRVQDHGIGIAEDYLEQIFQRFYRVDTSLTREVSGLGLGLAICKQIVALHHGLLWAESEVGKGSTFHVLLPAASDGLS